MAIGLIVTTNDGEVFTGKDEREIVLQMRNTQWNAPERKRDYMLEVIERAETMTGVFVNQDELPTNVDTDETLNPAAFLRYLRDAKLIEMRKGPIG